MDLLFEDEDVVGGKPATLKEVLASDDPDFQRAIQTLVVGCLDNFVANIEKDGKATLPDERWHLYVACPIAEFLSSVEYFIRVAGMDHIAKFVRILSSHLKTEISEMRHELDTTDATPDAILRQYQSAGTSFSIDWESLLGSVETSRVVWGIFSDVVKGAAAPYQQDVVTHWHDIAACIKKHEGRFKPGTDQRTQQLAFLSLATSTWEQWQQNFLRNMVEAKGM